MADDSNPRVLPETYSKPTNVEAQLVEADFLFRYILTDDGKIKYTVHDGYEHTHETVICTLEQFECALAAMVDDSQLSGAEYEQAELAMGSVVRWIP